MPATSLRTLGETLTWNSALSFPVTSVGRGERHRTGSGDDCALFDWLRRMEGVAGTCREASQAERINNQDMDYSPVNTGNKLGGKKRMLRPRGRPSAQRSAHSWSDITTPDRRTRRTDKAALAMAGILCLQVCRRPPLRVRISTRSRGEQLWRPKNTENGMREDEALCTLFFFLFVEFLARHHQ